MARLVGFLVGILVCVGVCPPQADAQEQFRRLPVKEYRDKMLAGWIGQMVGVTWPLNTEFRYNGEIVPEYMIPKWEPVEVNDGLQNDDVFNDTKLLYLIEKGGLDVSNREAAILRSLEWTPDIRLLMGVAPPDLYGAGGRVQAGGLGYQIAADVTGLVAPGLPNVTISLGERLANPYGDSLYAGQFVGAMYAEAFFESSHTKIIQAALKAIPEGSGYAQMVRDVIKWHQENPKDWQKTWHLINDKYRPEPRASWDSRVDYTGFAMETDVKLNGAYIVLGLLYGDGDLDRTIIIAARGGDDSDCNPANAAGVLFTARGYSKLPQRFQHKIDGQTLIHWDESRDKGVYTFPQALEVTEKVARQAVVRAGGRIEKGATGEEVFVIPVQQPKPSRLYKTGDTIPVENSRLTKEELAGLRGIGTLAQTEFKKWARGWEVGGGCDLGLLPEIHQKEHVFVTYPPDRNTACTLSKSVTVPGGEFSTFLEVVVSAVRGGAWTLVVKVDGKEVFLKHVAEQPPWMHAKVDLTPYAGKTVKLEVVDQPHRWEGSAVAARLKEHYNKLELANQPHRWQYPWAYWGQILLESSDTTGAPRRVGFDENFRGEFRQEPMHPGRYKRYEVPASWRQEDYLSSH